MSLILDALRKSEAERRRGQAPDLFAPVAARVVPGSKQPVAIIVVAVATLLAAVAIVFWPGQPSRKPAPANDSGLAATPANDRVMPMPTMPTAMSTNGPLPKPPSVTPIDMPRKPIEAKPAVKIPPAEISAAAIDRPPSTGGDSVAAPAADVTDTSATDNEPALPSLATLDSATRATLPPLQLSMHVWNPDAALRFAIIDGQRLGEGGTLAGAVVTEIRRDGVVLDIGGRQFLLPRP